MASIQLSSVVHPTRRRLLSGTALAGFGIAIITVLAGAKGALALTVEPADKASNDLYLSACGGRDVDTHRRLLADIRLKLGATASEEDVARAAAATVCPVCGCSLTRS